MPDAESNPQMPLGHARPVIGHRMRCAARDVQPGDFTTFTGYRAVVAVKPASGKRRRFTRVDGTSDAIARDQLVTVYRHAR